MASSKRDLSLEGAAADTPNKRRRNNDKELPLCFSNLPNDCKVHTFSFLPTEDMNTAACCNKDCQEVRANESLDQQRTGTIVWTERTNESSFCNKLSEVQPRFTGNRTRMKVVGIERGHQTAETLIFYGTRIRELANGGKFEQVTTLDCSKKAPDGPNPHHPCLELGNGCSSGGLREVKHFEQIKGLQVVKERRFR